MQDLNLFNNEITMSSIEISELTSKRHDHVIRDIDNTIKTLSPEMGLGFKSSTYKDSTGKTNRMYELDYDSTMCLVSGYNPELRMRIIKRLKELEQEKSYGNFKLPKTYEEALENLLQNVKEKKLLEKQVLFLEPFKEKVDNSQAIFSKKEKVYDKEVGYKKDIKKIYPFIGNDKLSMILEYYTKSKFKDTNKYIKSELDCIDVFFSECDMEVKPDGKSVVVSHECLLGRNMFVRKDSAIKYLGYCEEDFE